jgi:hypothetical protein
MVVNAEQSCIIVIIILPKIVMAAKGDNPWQTFIRPLLQQVYFFKNIKSKSKKYESNKN